MTATPVHFPEWLRANHIDVWLLLDGMRRHVESNGEWTGMERQQALVSALLEECLALGQECTNKEMIHLLDASLHSLSSADTRLAGLKRFLQRERRRAVSLLRQDEPDNPHL